MPLAPPFPARSPNPAIEDLAPVEDHAVLQPANQVLQLGVLLGAAQFVAHLVSYRDHLLWVLGQRRQRVSRAIPSMRRQLETLPGRIQKMEQRLAAATDATDRARLQTQFGNTQAYLEELKLIEMTLPTLIFDRSLILHKKARETRLLYFGRGHTTGDVVVFLPKERVVVTGDLLTSGIPFYRDAYPSEWVATLQAVARLGFDQVIPGHGPVQQGKAHLHKLIAFMEEMVAGVKQMVAAGKSLEEVKAGLDLSKYKADFSNFARASMMAIERTYAETTGRLKE